MPASESLTPREAAQRIDDNAGVATRRRAKSLLVEFIGVPGSGKTTLATQVLRTLRAHGVPLRDGESLEQIVRSRFVGGSSAGTAARLSPFLFRRQQWWRPTFDLISTSANRRRVVKRFVRLVHRLRAVGTLVNDDAAILLPDEWLLHEQMLLQLDAGPAAFASADAVLKLLLAELPVRLMVVHCHAPLELAAKRIAGRRTRSDLDGMSVPDLLQVLSRARPLVLRQVEALRSARCHIVDVNLEEGSDGVFNSLSERMISTFSLQPVP